MQPWRVTVVLMLASVLLVACFGRGLLDVYRWWHKPPVISPTKATLDQVRDRHASDPEVALGYAVIAAQRLQWQKGYEIWKKEYPTAKPEAGWAPDAAFAQAVRLAPRDPAPRLYSALQCLRACGVRSDDDPKPADARWRPAPRTPQEAQALDRATVLLVESAACDPQNSFVHYLLAYTAFARRDDAAIYREIARAEQCPNWTRYQSKVGLAVWRVFSAAGDPPVSAAADAVNAAQLTPLSSGSVLRAIGRLLTRQADVSRLAGDHTAALAGYASVLRLAHTMRVHATDGIELLVGQVITPMATGPLLSRQERQRLSNAPRDDNWGERRRMAEAEAFAVYARQHGQPELGALAIADTRAFGEDGERLRAAFDWIEQRPSARVVKVAMAAFRPLLYQGAALLAVLALCGLLLLLRRLKRLSLRPVTISGGLWASGLVVLWGVAVGAAAWRSLVISPAPTEAMEGFYLFAVYSLAVGAIVPWMLGMGIAIRARIRSLAENEADRRPSAIATLALTMPPTIAAQMLFAVLILLIIYALALQDSHLSMRMLSEGELRALGLR